MSLELPKALLDQLAAEAWRVRQAARSIGGTKVGCAVLSGGREIFVGCNVEHRFRSHDIHAEVNAISSLVAGDGGQLIAVYIAAERNKFTPCGGCLDWIFELGGEDCLVYSQSRQGGPRARYTAAQLMPHYPN
jgi:cytidine deaminase